MYNADNFEKKPKCAIVHYIILITVNLCRSTNVVALGQRATVYATAPSMTNKLILKSVQI